MGTLDLRKSFRERCYAAKRAPETAERWLQRFYEDIDGHLSYKPERCQLAVENRKKQKNSTPIFAG